MKVQLIAPAVWVSLGGPPRDARNILADMHDIAHISQRVSLRDTHIVLKLIWLFLCGFSLASPVTL